MRFFNKKCKKDDFVKLVNFFSKKNLFLERIMFKHLPKSFLTQFVCCRRKEETHIFQEGYNFRFAVTTLPNTWKNLVCRGQFSTKNSDHGKNSPKDYFHECLSYFYV